MSAIGRFMRRARSLSKAKSLEGFSSLLGTSKQRLRRIETGGQLKDVALLCTALNHSGLPTADLLLAILEYCDTSDSERLTRVLTPLSSTPHSLENNDFLPDIFERYGTTPLIREVIQTLVEDHGLERGGAELLADLMSQRSPAS